MALAERPFPEPLFDETVVACKSLLRTSSHYRSVSDMELLIEWSAGIPHAAPTPTMQKLAAFCNITVNEDEWAKMQQRSGYQSKYPDKVFHRKANPAGT